MAPTIMDMPRRHRFAVRGKLAEGCIEIVDTPEGERLRFTATCMLPNLEAEAVIDRRGDPAPTNVLSMLRCEEGPGIKSDALGVPSFRSEMAEPEGFEPSVPFWGTTV